MICNDELEAFVIICTRDRQRLLAEAVESIWRGSRVPAEVLVVDQSSIPHPWLSSASGPPGCRLRYMWRAVRGFSRAPNCAVAAARNKILFIDDEVLVPVDWFENLCSAVAAQDPRWVVIGRVERAAPEIAGGFSPSLIANDSPAVFDRYTKIRDVRYLAAYRIAQHDVGAFDERLGPGTRFPAAEDNDLAFRLPKAAYQIAYVPEATVCQHARGSDYLAVRCNYGKRHGTFDARYLNRERSSALQRLRHETPKYLSRSLRRLKTDWREAAGDALFGIALFFGANEWLRRRSLAH